MNALLFLSLLPAAMAATPCQDAILASGISGEQLEINQRCVDIVSTGKGKEQTYYICVLAGPPAFASQEELGTRPVTIIQAENEASAKHFAHLIGRWHNSTGNPQPGERESVQVSVNGQGTQITRRRTRILTKATTTEKISYQRLEKALRYERYGKESLPGSPQKLVREATYECDQPPSAEVQSPAPKGARGKAPAGIVLPDGALKKQIAPRTHRPSGISQ